jgi:hypothetical protein
MKTKNVFEASGNSPTKISKSGAPIQTGRGLEETKRRITEAFQRIRQHPAPPVSPTQVEYDEHQETRFRERAHRLSLAALTSSSVVKTEPSRADVGCWEITVPSESASDLIAKIMNGDV